jgi:hypothetical protein
VPGAPLSGRRSAAAGAPPRPPEQHADELAPDAAGGTSRHPRCSRIDACAELLRVQLGGDPGDPGLELAEGPDVPCDLTTERSQLLDGGSEHISAR